MYNQNSGYGKAMIESLHNVRANGGKVFMVAKTAAAGRQVLQELFDVDPDGINRYASTIDAAIGYTTASRGDVILVAPGHTETFTGAAGFALDVAGVSLIGLGNGNNRPVLTYGSTDNSATTTQSGDDTKFLNFVLVCNDDGLTNAHVVTGNNCEVDVEFQDTSAAIEAATAIRLDTADNCKLNLKYNGFIAGNAVVRAIAVDDCDNVNINVDFYGVVTTAVVNFVDSLSTNVHVTGRMYTSGTTNFSKTVVDTVGSSIWTADFLDATANARVSGGNVSALASDDVTAVAAAVGTVSDAALADTIEGAAATTQSMVTDLKGALQRLGADNANNTAATTLVADNRDGSLLERTETVIAALKDDIATNMLGINNANNASDTSSVTANRDGSIVERLEQLEATVQKTISKVQTTPSGGADALFTITGGPIHVVSIWGVVTTVLAGAANGTLQATVTTPAGTVALSTTVAIDNDAAGTTYTFVGPTGVLTPTTAGAVLIDMGSTTLTETQYIVPIGNINFLTSGALTGAITWYMSYIPSPSAVVTAA